MGAIIQKSKKKKKKKVKPFLDGHIFSQREMTQVLSNFIFKIKVEVRKKKLD